MESEQIGEARPGWLAIKKVDNLVIAGWNVE